MPAPGGTPLSPTAAPGRMEPLRRAVRDRADLVGATCSALVFVRPAVPRQELELLLGCQRPNGIWPAVGNGTAGVSFWSSAMAVNTLMILGAAPETFAGALDSLVNCRPLEASWLVRLKFRLSDRQVRFDPTKYGWAWVPDTVSWVVPTSMALIALERAKRQGLIRGSELQKRLRLGVEMLLDRVCPEGGWNAGNAVVYGVPLRPHVDATALALAALRVHHDLPIVRDSLTWILNRIDCPSAYSLAWVILSAAAYKDLRSDVSPALDMARDRLAALVDDPRESRTHRRSRWPLSPWNRKPRLTPSR